MALFDIDFWTNRVNELTAWKNLIVANSKRIFQLPVSTTGTKLVAVHNETSGETEQFNLTEALESITIGSREIKLIETSSYDFISSDKTKILICEQEGVITYNLDGGIFSANDVIVIHNEKDYTSTIQNIDSETQDLYYNGEIITTAINIPKGSMVVLTCVSTSEFILNVFSFTTSSQNLQQTLNNGGSAEIYQIGSPTRKYGVEMPFNDGSNFVKVEYFQDGNTSTQRQFELGSVNDRNTIVEVTGDVEKTTNSFSKVSLESTTEGEFTAYESVEVQEYNSVTEEIINSSYNLRKPIPKSGTEVIIEQPHKEVSGTYRVATKDDIPSNIILYPTTAVSDIATYYKLVIDVNDTSYDDVAVDVSTGALSTTDVLISSLASAQGIFSGNITGVNISVVGNIKRVSGTANGTFYFKIFHRDSSGTETLIGTSDVTSEVSSSTYVEFSASALILNENFNSTDRIVYKFYGNKVGGGSNPTFDFQFGGTAPVRILTPIPTSLVLTPIYESLEQLELNKADKNPLFKKSYFDDLVGYGIGFTGSIFATTGTLESEGNICIIRSGTATTTSFLPSEDGRNGIIKGGTGTGAANTIVFNYRRIYINTSDFLFKTAIRLQTLSDATNTYTIITGIEDTGNNVTNNITINYTHSVNGGKFLCKTTASSISTTSDSGVTVAINTWYELKIIKISGVCYFYINEILVSTISTNVPSNFDSSVVSRINKLAGTTTRTFDIDYLLFQEL